MWKKFLNYNENKLLQEHAHFKQPLPFNLGEEWLTSEKKEKTNFLNIVENIEKNSEQFFNYNSILLKNFILDKNNLLKFPSPYESPYKTNNTCYVDYYPTNSNSAVIILPHWNSKREKYIKLAKFLQFLGYTTLCSTLPYHQERNVETSQISNFFLSSNIGRTIKSIQQAVLDTRALIDWLIAKNYSNIILLGVSIGTPPALITAAHDTRVKGVVLCLTSSDFGEAVWTGQSTKHIKISLENTISIDELKKYWSCISPKTYVKKLIDKNQKHLILYGKYDNTMFPYLAEELCNEYKKFNIPCRNIKLNCGHYTIRSFPYKYQLVWHLENFLKQI